MKTKIKIEKEVEFTHLKISIGARYWEDSKVNGVEDTKGDLIPLREGEYWGPVINLETGQIINWPQVTTAEIHYKCCDNGKYWLMGEDVVYKYKGYYVPNILDLTGEGFGDYIILSIDENGIIQNWKVTQDHINDFISYNEE